MQRMHATEGGYDLVQLSGLRLRVAPWSSSQRLGNSAAAAGGNGTHGAAAADCFEVSSQVLSYNHKAGCLRLPVLGEGAQGAALSCVSIAEIPATHRAFPAASQVGRAGPYQGLRYRKRTSPHTPTAMLAQRQEGRAVSSEARPVRSLQVEVLAALRQSLGDLEARAAAGPEAGLPLRPVALGTGGRAARAEDRNPPGKLPCSGGASPISELSATAPFLDVPPRLARR